MQPGDISSPKTPDNTDQKSEVELKIAQEKAQTSPPATSNYQTPPAPLPVTAPEQAAAAWQNAQNDEISDQPIGIAPIEWTASEFVDNEKSSNWFMSLAIGTAVLVAVTYLITRELLTSVAIIIASALFGVTAKRKPRTQHYQIDQEGVSIGGKSYPYTAFRSFSVFEDGHFSSIQLTPLKRFALPTTLYFPPENGEQIVETLGSYLPHENRNHDPVDRLMHKLRF